MYEKFFQVINDCFGFAGPLFLNKLIQFLQQGVTTSNKVFTCTNCFINILFDMLLRYLFPLGTILLFRIPSYTTLYVNLKHCKYLSVKYININMVMVMVMPFLFFFLK